MVHQKWSSEKRMAVVELATVLPGVKGFNEGNVNDTFRGQIMLGDRTVKHAILKDLDPRQLANELLVSVLAQEAGLPVPDCFLTLVRGSDMPVSKGPALPDGNRLVFASVDVKVPNITFHATVAGLAGRNKLISDILDWPDLGALYGFDTWVANVDRHPGTLLCSGKDQFWLIDHGHCLSGPAWSAAALDPDGSYRNRLTEWLTSLMDLAQKKRRSTESVGFATSIKSLDVRAAVVGSWIRALLPPTDLDAVEKFLTLRVSNVPRHASRALGVPLIL
jgi:hypothetical protein